MYDPNAPMSDEELLGYALIHCQTDRALFSRRDANRLLKLAGYTHTLEAWEKFVAIHEDEMVPLVAKARERLRTLGPVPPDEPTTAPDPEIGCAGWPLGPPD